MKIFFLGYLILLSALLLFSCKKNPVSSPPDSNDTTSHNFTFQTWHFGKHSSSILYDVAIINENDIWAVGEIYLLDTLGQPDPHPFGIIHWNGTEWNVKKITAVNPSGGISYITPTGIFCINPSQIWLAGGSVFLFNGQSITKAFWLINYPGYNGGIFNNGQTAQKIFGVDSEKIFTVGNNGALGVYDGNIWHKLETGTVLDIYDIRGGFNKENELELYAVAADQGISTDKKVLKIRNNAVTDLSVSGINSSIKGIWFKPEEKYYVVGSGIFSKTDIGSELSWESIWQGITQYYTNSIDGNDLNDIAVCGAYGELLHYNGIKWKSFQSELQLQEGSYQSIKIKNNNIIAVGYDSPQAVITIGKR